MSEGVPGGLEVETPVNPYSLLEAVNSSGETANTAWLIFLGIMAYLMVAVAGVTHRDLLLETPVSLPVLGVQIQQSQFFRFAPVILVLFHLGVVSQLVLLARKTLEFDYAVRALESSERRTHPLRLELHNFFFVQAIAGPHRSPMMGALLHGMSWLTLVILPVVLLLYIQISFLPYHSVSVTWAHRICVLVDILFLAFLGVFLMRLETSFWSAFAGTSVRHPVSLLTTVALMVLTVLFSFFVATVPGERLEQWASAFGGPRERGGFASSSERPPGFLAMPVLSGSRDGSLFGLFHRNLIVADLDLVQDNQVSGNDATLVLRGRDLRYANLERSDLHGADLTGANLDGARLVGADLRGARLACADMTSLLRTEDRILANCPTARKADFSRARMKGARLAGADLRDAKFEEADLERVDLTLAQLTGANFGSARLDKADLGGGVNLQGANFLLASLQGADLTGSQMQFADLSSAQMQGAILSYVQLQGAIIRDTNLEAADLTQVRLQGADLTGALIGAADLRGAMVWYTAPPATARFSLTDASQLDIAPLTAEDVDDLSLTIAGIGDPLLKIRVRERLAAILDVAASKRWASAPDHQAWQDLVTRSRSAIQTGFEQQLTEYLASMMCKPRWRNGAIATGIARRAHTRHFRGSLQTIHERLSSPACVARDGVDSQLINRLATRLDIDQEARNMAHPPSQNIQGMNQP